MAIDLDVNSFTELNNNIIDINNKTASLANMVLNPVPVGSTNKLAVKRGTTWNIEGEEAYNGRLQNFGDISGNISLDMDGAGCRTAMIAEVVGDTFITGFGDNFSSGVVYVLFLRQDSIGGHSVRWPYGASVLNMVGPDPNQITAVYVIKLPNGKIFVKCEAFQNTVEIGSILKEIEKPNIIYPVEGDSVSRTFEWQKEEPVFHGMVLSGLSSDWEVAKDELFLEIYFSSYDNTVHVFDLLTSVSWVGWSYFRTRYNGTIDGLPTSSLWSDSFSRFFGNTTEKDLPIFGKLSVVAITKVLDLTTNVGQAVDGSNGGSFTIASDGAWTFDPTGDFAALSGVETADTSVAYHASDGVSEAMATLTVTVSSGAVQLWTPAEISGARWFDPDDAAHRVLDGSALTSLVDVVGGSLALSQSTEARKPSLVTAALADYDVASFDGGDYLAGTITAPGSAPISIFAVWLTTDSATDVVAMVGAASTNAGLGLGRNPTTGGYNAFVWAGAEKYISGTYSRWVMTLGQRNSSGLRAGLDGSLTAYASTSLNIASGAINVGRTPQATGYLNGQLAALVIGAFTDDEVDRLFGWAAHKYGLAANLQSDHPYKSAAPTI